jgi:hypothetical protein
MEIFHCIARAAPTTVHGNFDNMREIPLDRSVVAHPRSPPNARYGWNVLDNLFPVNVLKSFQ